jgi:aspartyl-tRNA(Asn)/glutamyl-tRNA(Gln) amidotransferase subunit A
MTQLADLTATELLAHFRTKALSPVEVTRAVLARVKAYEPHLNATYALDAEGALAAAAASEARYRMGEPTGALDGVPITIKENISTRGVPKPMGTAATVLAPEAHDAPPAARVREAGAVIITKTTMPDYGMLTSGLSSFHPLTRNPWDLSRNPGGSSAGASAAAAAGYGPLHLGTDIGGSVRLPASFTGVFALKPSLGRVPIDPPYMGRVVGPMTRTVADSALLMGVLSLPDERDYMSLPYQAQNWDMLERGVKGLRIGLHMDAGCGLPLDPEVRDAVSAAAKLFETAGAIVEPLDPFMTRAMLAGIDWFFRVRSCNDLSKLSAETQRRILPFIRDWAMSAEGLSANALFDHVNRITEIRQRTVAATGRFDYVLSPVAPGPAFPAEWPCPSNDVKTALDHIGFTVPYNLSEQPAASLHCGFTKGGLPIGLQIAGKRFDDLGVLQLSRAFEQMREPMRAWPTFPQ